MRRLKKVADEIIVVDNNSTDRSYELAKKLGVRVVREPRQKSGSGYGFAHQTGLSLARGDFIVTVDADGEHPIELIPQIVRYAQEKECDFITCNRVATTPNGMKTKIRRFGIFLMRMQTNLLFGKAVSDPLCGMWVFRREIVPLLKLSEGGWNLSVEIKLSALTNPRIRFAEYPIMATVRKDGRSKQILWKTGLEHMLFIFRYKLAKMGIPSLRSLIRLWRTLGIAKTKS